LVENRNCVEKGIYHEKESNQNSLACNRFFSNGNWNDRSGTSGTSDNPISFIGIFLSGTVPVFGSDWGGADSVSVRKMACD
jgi:hypothetical protein